MEDVLRIEGLRAGGIPKGLYDTVGAMLQEAVRQACLAACESIRTRRTARVIADTETTDGRRLHHGDTALDVDGDAHSKFQTALQSTPEYRYMTSLGIQFFPVVVGEEDDANERRATDDSQRLDVFACPPDHLIFVLDALDGSQQWRITKGSWAIAGTVLLTRSDGGHDLLGAFMGLPDNRFLYLRIGDPAALGKLYLGDLTSSESFEALTSPNPTTQGKEEVIVTNWYKFDDPNHRSAAEHAFNVAVGVATTDLNPERSWFAANFGGNPAVANLLTYEVTAVYTTDFSSTWDAVGALMAVHSDAVVGDHDGNIWRPHQAYEMFRRLVLDADTCPIIPPYIAAMNMDVYEHVRANIQSVSISQAAKVTTPDSLENDPGE